MIAGDFVQFYEPRKNIYRPDSCYYSICNGFNYISDLIDINWVDTRRFREYIPRHKKVYVSVWYGFQQNIVLYWARKFPKSKFVLGGPLYKGNQIKYVEKIPDNVYFTTELAEDHFGVPLDLKRWKFTFPHTHYPLQYSYYVGAACYWNKCSFCTPNGNGGCKENDRRTSYDLEPLENSPDGSVNLSVPAPTPKMLRDILPKIAQMSKHKKFGIYIRAAPAELEVLKDIKKQINFEKTTFCIGVEFASDRMLKIMNKGVTVDDYLNMLLFIRKMHGRFICYHIVNWPDIIEDDVENVRMFFKKLDTPVNEEHKHISGPLIGYRNIVPETKINSNVPMSMYDPFSPDLTDTERKLNDKYIKIFAGLGVKERVLNDVTKRVPIMDKEYLYKKFIHPLGIK